MSKFHQISFYQPSQQTADVVCRPTSAIPYIKDKLTGSVSIGNKLCEMLEREGEGEVGRRK